MNKKVNWNIIIGVAIFSFLVGFYFGIKKGAEDATKAIIDSGVIENTQQN